MKLGADMRMVKVQTMEKREKATRQRRSTTAAANFHSLHTHPARLTGLFPLCVTHTPSTSHWTIPSLLHTHTQHVSLDYSLSASHTHPARLTGLFPLCFTHTPSTSHWTIPSLLHTHTQHVSLDYSLSASHTHPARLTGLF